MCSSSSTLSSSSESDFHMIHSVSGAFHCVFNLIYWIFISSTLSVWLFFSYSLYWILFSFLILMSLFHLSFFVSIGVYSRLLWTVWIEIKSLFEFSGCSSLSFSLRPIITGLVIFGEVLSCIFALFCFCTGACTSGCGWVAGQPRDGVSVIAYLWVLGVSRCWQSQAWEHLTC